MKKFFLFTFIVFLLSFFTYFKGYSTPQKQFWDENYHIASAYKYLNDTFFLEPHPPLGKLFIALGEKLLNPNDSVNTKSFLKTDYIKKFPKDFRFDGVRFFPALFGWLNAVLFFILLYLITDRLYLSFFGSFLYIFDNALIVHSRSAMLESTQLFFILLSLITFVFAYKKDSLKFKHYFWFTLFLTLSVMVKLNSLILILLYIPLFYKEYKNHISIKEVLKKIFLIVLVSIASIMIIFKLHFTLTQNLIKTKTYNLTKSEIKLVNSKKLSLIDGIKAYIRYIKIYEKGVPKYNPCKKNGENGSLVMTWPLMDKTINYRWKKVDNKTKYLYLVGNPLIWLTGLIGVLLSISMLVGRFVYGLKIKSSKFEYIFIFTILYISYMIAVLQIDRVMYLYHYFIPLIFSFILAVLQFEYLFEDCLNKKDKVFLIASGLFIALILYVWWWFSPLTYYEYLDIYQFNQRNWFDFWQLKAVS